MTRFIQFKTSLLAVGFAGLFVLAQPAGAQSVTWELPVYPPSWGGAKGAPATTNGTELILQGQPAVSVQTFTAPVTISYDILLNARTAPDGGLWLLLLPPGEAAPTFNTFFAFLTDYRNYSPDALLIDQSLPDTNLWSNPVPFTVTAGTTYHLVVTVAANGQVSWTINGQAYSIPNTVVCPFTQFRLQVQGWQPTDLWQVNNFTVSSGSAPTCPNLVGTWSGTASVADLQLGYSSVPLSINITDQSTNSCAFRGYLVAGTTNCFTGALLNNSNLVFTFTTPGLGSAVLDTNQTPPAMNNFVFQETGSADSVITAVATLTQTSTNAPAAIRCAEPIPLQPCHGDHHHYDR